MSIGFILKGQKQDIIILAESFKEAKMEMKKHEKDIKNYIGDNVAIKTRIPKKKIGKISITNLILELRDGGFFKKPQSSDAIRKKLASGGHHYAASSLTWPLQHLIKKHELGRVQEDKGWKYVGR